MNIFQCMVHNFFCYDFTLASIFPTSLPIVCETSPLQYSPYNYTFTDITTYQHNLIILASKFLSHQVSYN